jgi:FemAB-related protein (PEP-CTERM system-associated)
VSMPSSSVALHQGSDAQWDEFVRNQRGWTHFHLAGWRRVIERVFHHECLYLSASANGAMVACLPLVRVQSVVFGRFLVSMPFLNYGGPLGSEAGIRALTTEAVRIADRHRVKLLELRSGVPLSIDLSVSHRKVTFILDLPSTPEALWSSLPAKLRSQIRRPQKDGVVVRSGADQVGAFYDVFAQHMRDLGTPVMPRRFFETVADVFPDDVHFAVAYHDNEPVACGCGFLWGEEFEITWASALRSHKALSPNMLVYWELMAEMSRRGVRRFNFGRCTPGSGTYRFKTQWGGRETPLWWYQHSARGNHDGGVPRQDKGMFALASRAWRRLPLRVTNLLGPSIVRFIP